jgi:hypothetical protein
MDSTNLIFFIEVNPRQEGHWFPFVEDPAGMYPGILDL